MQMDMSLDEGFAEEGIVNVEFNLLPTSLASEFDIIPKKGKFLGLDISETSSGICLYVDGVKSVFNSTITDVPDGEFLEVRLRRQLKSDLTEVIGGMDLDLVLVEDAFQGLNPNTTRVLYALNTAIDELILDGVCTCKEFHRVNNGTWKRWLYTIDTEGYFKGLKDKPRIEKCLAMLGVHESGDGYQDRLDACGLLVGYFLCGRKELVSKTEDCNIRVSTGDIMYAFAEDEELIRIACRNERKCDSLEVEYISIGAKTLTKKRVKDILVGNVSKLIILEDERILGAFGNEIGIRASGKGYLGFWLKRSKYRKLGIVED